MPFTLLNLSAIKTKQNKKKAVEFKELGKICGFFFFLMEMSFTILCKTRECPLELALYARNIFVITYASEASSCN